MSEPDGLLAVALISPSLNRIGGDPVLDQLLERPALGSLLERPSLGSPRFAPDASVDLDFAACGSVEEALAAGAELPCHAVDPDLFFAENPAEVERAKALCVSCPVRALCLGAALERREPWGVWGGEWFDGGHAIGRKRPRGRPRKNVAA